MLEQFTVFTMAAFETEYQHCVLCGQYCIAGAEQDVFTEDNEWYKHYRGKGRHKMLYVDVDKLEKKYFTNRDNTWRSLYRLCKWITMPAEWTTNSI